MDSGRRPPAEAIRLDLFLDLQGAQTEGSRLRGIGRYTRDLTAALHQSLRKQDALHLGWNNALHHPIPDLKLQGTDGGTALSAPYGTLKRARFDGRMFDANDDINDRLFRYGLDLSRSKSVIFSSLMELDDVNFMLPRHLNFGPDVTSYAIVYDLIPYLFQDAYFPAKGFRDKYLAHLQVKLSADVLFSISDHTKADLVSKLGIDPDRVVTIGTGIDLERFDTIPSDRETFFDRLSLTRPFLFFLGGDEFRKNLRGLVQALTALPESGKAGLQTLISGKVQPDVRASMTEIARQGGLPQDALVFTDYLSHADLLQAYRSCEMTVIPSIYEGFGLPALEAMACGSAVIASGNSSMAEILTDAAFLFDGSDSADIARKIQFVLDNPNAVASLKSSYPAILSRFTWQGVAERVMQTCAERQPPEPASGVVKRSQPRSLNLVLLGQPDPAWLATIQGLASRNSVTCYCTPDARNVSANSSLPLRHVDWLERLPASPSPYLTFVTDIQSLWQLALRRGLDEHFIILDGDAFAALQIALNDTKRPQTTTANVKQFAERLKGAFGLSVAGVLHGDGILHHVCVSETGAVMKQDAGRLLAPALAHEINLYPRIHPQWLAADLRSIMERHGHAGRLDKTVAALAAVSRFDTRPISL